MSLPIASGTWTADKSHSHLGFTARHLGFTKVYGSFGEYELEVNVGDTLESSSVKSTVDLTSVSTGNTDRDNHLKGADFFGNSDKPVMEFQSTAISGTPEDFKITGDLTINGKTLPVSFEAQFLGLVEQDPSGNTKSGFEAETEINRTDWGIDWNVPVGSGMLVSEKIKINLDIQLTPKK